MAVELLPEELWNEVKPLLPSHAAQPQGGRPPVDDRLALRGLIFILRSGMAYQLLPREVFGVSGSTCWRRLGEWTRAGVWPQLHQRVLNRLGKLGEIDLDKVVVDSQSVRAVFGGTTRVPTRQTGGKTGANVTSSWMRRACR